MISLLVTFTIGWLGYQIKSKGLTLQEPPTMLKEVESRHITPQGYFPQEPQYWLYYGTGPGATVKGWPSQGGIYTLQVSSRVEIDFLDWTHLTTLCVQPIQILSGEKKRISTVILVSDDNIVVGMVSLFLTVRRLAPTW
jgi:hypothetical protein